MANEIRVDPQVVIPAADGLARCADDLLAAVHGATSAPEAATAWGGDENGSLLGAVYAELCTWADEAAGSQAQRLRGESDLLEGLVKVVKEGDEDAGRAYHAVRQDMDLWGGPR